MPNRTNLYQRIMELYPIYLTRFPQTQMVEVLYGRYRLSNMSLMSIGQVEDFMNFLEMSLPEYTRSTT